jgi:hypothetical protein
MPDLSKIRKGLFWATKIENIDWVQHKQYVIDRDVLMKKKN